MRALLLGGTGAIGTDLARMLANRGWNVNVTSRSERANHDNITYVNGNALDINFLQSILNCKWDVIIDFMVYSTPAFEARIHHILKSTSQYIYLSSARVYAESKRPITESSPRLLDVCRDSKYLATDEYALSKARQEDILLSNKLPNWTIIRPYITYGVNRLQLGLMEKEEWLYRAVHARSIVTCSEINQKLTTMTSGSDVSEAISMLCGFGKALGEVFQIMNNEELKWSKVLDIYSSVLNEHLGYKLDMVEIDQSLMTDIAPRFHQLKYDRLYDRTFDNSKIQAFTSKTTFEEPSVGLRKNLCAFLENINFLNINWFLEARKDAITGGGFPKIKEFTNIREIATYTKSRLKYSVKHLINQRR